MGTSSARSPAEEEAWRYIVFRLENDPGFWFGLIAGDDRRPRRRLRDRAEAWCKANGVAFHEHRRPPGEMRMIAVDLSQDPEKGLHWIHADGPEGLAAEWDAGAKAMLMAMNERRDAYRRHLKAGVVVDGRLSLKPILRDFAPDMFSIRAFVAEPGADAGDPLPVLVRPGAYFQVPMHEEGESSDVLLARAERLAGIDDRDAVRLRLRALATAIRKLQDEGRWEEALAVAERLERESDSEPGTSRARVLRLFARATGIMSSLPLRAPSTALASIRSEMEEAQALAVGDPTGARSTPLEILILAELHVLRQLRRWGDVRASLAKFSHLADDASEAEDLYVPLAYVLYSACREAVAGLRAAADLEGAAATVDVMLELVQKARRRAPDDPRWRLEEGRALLLRIEVFAARGDFAAALRTSETVLDAFEEHGETHAVAWLNVRYSAQIRRLLALTALQDWSAVSSVATQTLAEAGELNRLDAWYVACVAILRAHAANELQDISRLDMVVDYALRALRTAVGREERGLAGLARSWLQPLLGAMAGALVIGPSRSQAMENVARFQGRLRTARCLFAGMFVQFPTGQSKAALLGALNSYLDGARLFRNLSRKPWLTGRAARRLRRHVRALRRWREGKRIPLFISRWAKETSPM